MSKTVVTLRSDVRAGDVEELVRLHGEHYGREHGFDASFADYVAGPLSRFAANAQADERIWIAERGGRRVGCIAIVRADEFDAQLRWFLVVPAARGAGLGTSLLREAVAFARASGYRRVYLDTVARLFAAARLYRAVGFRRTECTARRVWGVDVIEERYVLDLDG